MLAIALEASLALATSCEGKYASISWRNSSGNRLKSSYADDGPLFEIKGGERQLLDPLNDVDLTLKLKGRMGSSNKKARHLLTRMLRGRGAEGSLGGPEPPDKPPARDSVSL